MKTILLSLNIALGLVNFSLGNHIVAFINLVAIMVLLHTWRENE